MDRSAWLQEKRRLTEERYDTLWAPIYDGHWGATISPTHRQCLSRFLGLCPAHGLILDAACGTGKYWPMILARGHRERLCRRPAAGIARGIWRSGT